MSSKIGQCLICLSVLTASNTFVITKCGHTFHQNCIKQWIMGNKNCPTCRTAASETDIIKLFIQELEDDINAKDTVAKIEHTNSWKQHIGFYQLLKKKCKCKLLQEKNGDQVYRCKKYFNVTIKYKKEFNTFTVILSDGYIITIHLSMQLEILREKTNERSLITAEGERYEYFKTKFSENEKQNFVARNIDKTITVFSYNDLVWKYDDRITFYCPGFTATRYLKNVRGGGISVKISSHSNPDKLLEIIFCPQHETMCIKHLNGNEQYICNLTDKPCSHFCV